MIRKSLFVVDGENLLIRYKSMLKERTPKKSVIYKEKLYLWSPKITIDIKYDILRVAFYNTISADDKKMLDVKNDISNISYEFNPDNGENTKNTTGLLVPYLFKKNSQNEKTKSVDINLTIDALRHTYNNSIDQICIFSGDGDYIPLIQEIMRQGKEVVVYAFSSGVDKRLYSASDGFIDLDTYFFK